MRIMRGGKWYDLDEQRDVEEMQRADKARSKAKLRQQKQRVQKQLRRLGDRDFDEWLRREQELDWLREEAGLIDPGAPGTRLEQMADLMDDDERAEWIEAGMPDDWALLKEEEFAQDESKKSFGA